MLKSAVFLTLGLAVLAAMPVLSGCDEIEDLLKDGGEGAGDAGGGEDTGGVTPDSGVTPDAGGTPDTGVAEDAGGETDAGGGTDAGESTLPYIDSLDPWNGAANAEAALSINGANFASGAAVYFGADALAGAQVESAELITVTVPAALTANPGQYPVHVENVPGSFITSSNSVYFTVDQAAGAPVVVDYSPDNGVEGDVIFIIGEDLSGEELTITDADGTEVKSSTFGTISVWGGSKETAEFTVPAGWSTGAIKVRNSKGAFTGKMFNVGKNLTVAAGSTATASSEYSSTWPVAKGADNKLETSWFSKNGDCATDSYCTSVPWFLVTFAADHDVGRIAMRGNREYLDGYDFIKGKFEILDAADNAVWGQSHSFPAPDRDLDVTVEPAVSGRKVKFTSLADESIEPGFAELEVFEP